MALICFYRKQFQKSISILDSVEVISDADFLYVKKLQFQNLYELSQFDLLSKFVANTNRTFYRKIKKKYHWSSTFKFFKFSKKLLKLTLDINEDKIKEFILEIKEVPGLVNRDWLLEKSMALIQPKK